MVNDSAVGYCLGCGRRLTQSGKPFSAYISCASCGAVNVYENSQQPSRLAACSLAGSVLNEVGDPYRTGEHWDADVSWYAHVAVAVLAFFCFYRRRGPIIALSRLRTRSVR